MYCLKIIVGFFFFFQNNESTVTLEQSDFGLSISAINRSGGGGEGPHPRRVGGNLTCFMIEMYADSLVRCFLYLKSATRKLIAVMPSTILAWCVFNSRATIMVSTITLSSSLGPRSWLPWDDPACQSIPKWNRLKQPYWGSRPIGKCFFLYFHLVYIKMRFL